MWRRKPGSAPRSWGELKPVRLCEWTEEETRITVLVPRFGRGRIGQKLARGLRAKPFRVRLDDIGTFVWRRLDGATTVDGIAQAMRAELGARVEPAEERLVLFLRHLLRGELIRLE